MGESSRDRKRRLREAERRRQAVTMLQIAECTCRYAASQLGNGIGPEQARDTAQFAAQELSAVADALRRLTRPSGPERRVLAVRLSGLGLPTTRIAQQLGVSERCVRYYLAGRPARSSRTIGTASGR